MSSAGSSLVLAWLLRTGLTYLQRFVGATLPRIALGAALTALVAASLFSLHKTETLALYLSGRSYDARGHYQTALKLYKQAIDGFRYGDACQTELSRGLAMYPDNAPLYVIASIGEFLQTDATRYHRADAIIDAINKEDFSAEQLGGFGPEFLRGTEAVRKMVYAFYSKDFNFGEFLKRYPDCKQGVIDVLSGNLFSEHVEPIFGPMGEMCELPNDITLTG